MYKSHFFNYCQHCRVNIAAIEQAVLPHASWTFPILCIKAQTLANSAALQTSSSSQEKASVPVQLLARLPEKNPSLPETPIIAKPDCSPWHMAVGQARELLSSAHFLSLHTIHPCCTPITTQNPSPAAQISWLAVSFHNSYHSARLRQSKDVRRGRGTLQMFVWPLPSDTAEADKIVAK